MVTEAILNVKPIISAGVSWMFSLKLSEYRGTLRRVCSLRDTLLLQGCQRLVLVHATSGFSSNCFDPMPPVPASGIGTQDRLVSRNGGSKTFGSRKVRMEVVAYGSSFSLGMRDFLLPSHNYVLQKCRLLT
jgi:hypothetical protein